MKKMKKFIGVDKKKEKCIRFNLNIRSLYNGCRHRTIARAIRTEGRKNKIDRCEFVLVSFSCQLNSTE